MNKELRNSVLDFAKEMLDKLEQKEEDGFFGWNESENRDLIRDKLKNHVRRLIEDNNPQEIDIANLAMFLWYQRRKKAS